MDFTSSRAVKHARFIVYGWIGLSSTGRCSEVKLAIRHYRACRHSYHVHIMLSCHVSVRTVYIICGHSFAAIRNSSTTNTSARTSSGRREEMGQAFCFFPSVLDFIWHFLCLLLSWISKSFWQSVYLLLCCCPKPSQHLSSLSVNISQWGELELFNMSRPMSLSLYGFVSELTSFDKREKRFRGTRCSCWLTLRLAMELTPTFAGAFSNPLRPCSAWGPGKLFNVLQVIWLPIDRNKLQNAKRIRMTVPRSTRALRAVSPSLESHQDPWSPPRTISQRSAPTPVWAN